MYAKAAAGAPGTGQPPGGETKPGEDVIDADFKPKDEK
jgi:hypothetical protein